MRGRKRLPTKEKELRGTLKAERVVANEMTVQVVQNLPSPPEWLTEIGKEEFIKVTSELYNKQMLHQIDLKLIEAYCNSMALHIETEMMLREKGRIQVYRNTDGTIKHTPTLIQQNNEYNFFD